MSHYGMCSFPAPFGLRAGLLLFRNSLTILRHSTYRANPRACQCAPGRVYADAGNKPMSQLYDQILQVAPLTARSESMLRLSEEHKADVIE